MNAEKRLARRCACARTIVATSYQQGMGNLQGVEDRLAAALRDVLAKPGSLTRALVAYLMGIEMGVAEETARGLACGIEYLHTASLLFDDLPAMDDARVRRGMPCLHVAHGEAVTMLAALALINRGYSLLWQAVAKSHNKERRDAASKLVEECLGTAGLVGGQAYDLRGWRDGQTAGEVMEVARRKTATLLRLPLVLPAIIGHGSKREIQLLERLGLMRGLTYQAVDDLKDVMLSEATSGKSAGRDELMGRPNIVVAEGFQAALQRLRKMLRIGDQVQENLPGNPERWGMLSLIRVTLPMTAKVVTSNAINSAC
jgi:geranylgeranyl diphosphate synthase type II